MTMNGGMMEAASTPSGARVQTVVVLVTASSEAEATNIGHAAVEAGLAACANIVPNLTSLFRWKEKLSKEQEVLIILKSRRDVFQELEEVIRRHHSYEVPEIIALPIVEGSAAYLKWIIDSTVSR